MSSVHYSRRAVSVAVASLIFFAFVLVALQNAQSHGESLLQWISMNSFSPYAAVPYDDGGSVVHAFTQKLDAPQDIADMNPPDLGDDYSRLERKALEYRKRLAQLNHALHNRVYNAYRKHLLLRGFSQPAASTVSFLQSELDALKAHVVVLAQELDQKNRLSARMSSLQSQALSKMMARVQGLAALIHASAQHRIDGSVQALHSPIRGHLDSTPAPCLHGGCTPTSDLKWMRELSRALSLIQAQSIHQAHMMQHVSSLSHEVEALRKRLRRNRRLHPPYPRYNYGDSHARMHSEISHRSPALPAIGNDRATSLETVVDSSSRAKKMSALLDKAGAMNQQYPVSSSLGKLYDEIHDLRSLLSTLPNGSEKL
jgi:hypothetical protein